MATDDVEEKRVYGERAGKTELLVAAAMGVLSVEVSADRVGRFGVARRCDPADVAAGGGRIAVATDEDVLVREPGTHAFASTGFGPAVAVGFDDDAPVAGSPDGRLARRPVDGDSDADAAGAGDVDATAAGAGQRGGGRNGDGSAEWTELGRLDAEVRAIDGRLLAAADGVYRLPDAAYAGLDDVRDVAAAGPLAATGDGLYSLGNGWMDELDGAFRVAAAEGNRAHAATAEAFFERRSGGWREVDLPSDEVVVDVAYGETTYAVTADGVLLTAAEDGWRARSLGVEGVVGCAVG